MKTFIKGLVFGAGFAISFVVVLLIAQQLESTVNETTLSDNLSSPVVWNAEWEALSDDEKIASATVLVISRYKDTSDGGKIAYVTDIYQYDNSIKIDIDVGWIVKGPKFYPKNEHRTRTGEITLFSGEPLVKRSSLYLYEDRVAGFGDMPLEMLIGKFRKNGV